MLFYSKGSRVIAVIVCLETVSGRGRALGFVAVSPTLLRNQYIIINTEKRK